MKNKYEYFVCDLCGADNAVEVPCARLYNNNQPIHICTKCGFIYVQKRRSYQDIAKTWSDEIFGETYTARIPAVKARQTFVAEFIDTNVGLGGKNVCDIGAGEGQFLEIIKNSDYKANAFGIEASHVNCQKLTKAGIDCYQGTIEDFSSSEMIKEYSADIATIMWTLENCRSCTDMLSGAYEIVKDDGFLVVATGSRILVPFKKPLHLYLSTNPADTHCFRFSANTLRGILAISGFEPIHISNYIDSDVLCVIAKKKPNHIEIDWCGDDFVKVYNFFERWHQEEIYYR